MLFGNSLGLQNLIAIIEEFVDFKFFMKLFELTLKFVIGNEINTVHQKVLLSFFNFDNENITKHFQ